jgi:uncharacterized protein YcaQ
METMGIRQARRLALACAGLLPGASAGLPARARGGGRRARAAALAVLERFGYLQLDTVSIAGARSHAIVLLARLGGMDPALGEQLLRPGEPVFEYWGHEASWLPMDLYPALEFRRRDFRKHPWWGDVLGTHRGVAQRLRERLRDEGPLRALDMEGRGSRGWWDMKAMRRVAAAMWSSGELAVRERVGFQRSWDLAERVIPEDVRGRPLDAAAGIERLVMKALDGHGFATTGLIAATWRLSSRRKEVEAALRRLVEGQSVVPCALVDDEGRRTAGVIRQEHLELAARLDRLRPRGDRGVLLSPFDPLLWDRARVRRLFGFDQVLEIFKPASRRVHGYFCLPVLAGERLVARLDLKADRRKGVLDVLSARFEGDDPRRPEDGEAVRSALSRYAAALALRPRGFG